MPDIFVPTFRKKSIAILLAILLYAFLGSTVHAQSFPTTAPLDYAELFNKNLKKGGQYLNLNGQKIGDAGITALVKNPLIQNLVKIDLRYNGISSEGARVLAQASFPKLKELILRHNILGDEGAEAIALSEGFPKLEALQLGWAEVRDRGALAFVDRKITALEKLDLRGNFLANSTKDTLKQKLSHLKSLKLY
jgi:Ran GTPase-activating protein (RanGAP) involved in mRNA processing and transport